MTKWNNNIDTTLSFRMETNEEGKAYFDRMLREMKDKETAIRERIEQLFGEYIQIGGEKRDEDGEKAFHKGSFTTQVSH